MSGQYVPPSIGEDQGKVSKQDDPEGQYVQFTQTESQTDENNGGGSVRESKIGKKVSWMTSASPADSASSLSQKSLQYSGYRSRNEDKISFDGIKYNLMGTLNLFMQDSFTSYIVRGIQARNPNVGVVQILANPSVQKCKTLLSHLRVKCFIFVFLAISFLLTEAILGILAFGSEKIFIIILLVFHFLIALCMVWTLFLAARYFFPEKARISFGLCVLLLLIGIGILIAHSNEANALPNGFLILFLFQFCLSGLLYQIYRQIYSIYVIFV